MPIIFALILLTTMVIFAAAFRSVLIPVKAALVNILSVGATLGLTVWVWQDGNLAGLLGLSADPAGVIPFLPLFIVTTIYGLSMDYAVFLLSAIAEEHRAGKDARTAVVDGTLRTGRVISGAALVMITVAVPFTTADMTGIAIPGFALVVGVAIDATIVRLVLVPALLTLLGEKAWWWPALRPPGGAALSRGHRP